MTEGEFAGSENRSILIKNDILHKLNRLKSSFKNNLDFFLKAKVDKLYERHMRFGAQIMRTKARTTGLALDRK